MGVVKVNHIGISAELMRIIDTEQAWHYRIIPKEAKVEKWLM